MPTTALARVNELDRYMAEIGRYPILGADEEKALAEKWRDHGDVGAAHALVTANLRFVVKIAHEYKGYGMRVIDLVQEGSIGLMQAVKKFDPDRGYRLLSYAVYWIRSYIHTYLMSTMRMIKVGTTRAHRKLFFKLRALKGKAQAQGVTGRDEILDAVADEVGVTRADVEEMDRHLTGRDTSLDGPVADTNTALVELMPAPGPSHEEIIADLEAEADRAARLDTAIGTLDPRENEIIRKRYLTDPQVQLKDIGAAMGVTKQRVSQIERRALKKLKTQLSVTPLIR
jgi:RNA polymerase sigma-32 factor